MTDAYVLELLDPSVPSEREAYERAFYAGFRRAQWNKLVRQLWDWDDDAGRLATRIPYNDQILYAYRTAETGEIALAMGVNTALRTFQSLAYGFPAPTDPTGCCEFLTVFSSNDFQLRTKLRFWRQTYADLRARGFHTGYASTAPRVLGFYLRQGGRILSETEIQGEVRYFLQFDLNDSDWRGGRERPDSCRRALARPAPATVATT